MFCRGWSYSLELAVQRSARSRPQHYPLWSPAYDESVSAVGLFRALSTPKALWDNAHYINIDLFVTPSSVVRDLGQSGLTMQSHVRQTASRCFAVVRQLRTVRRQVPTSVFQSLVVALVFSRLDYCNSVLFGLPANLIQRLQSVHDAAARLIFRIRRSEHIYPSAHQPSLAARPRTYLLQTGSYDVSIHPRHRSALPTVMFHPRFRHDIQTTVAVFYLTSSRRSARSSLYSRQAGVTGFGCHRLERPAHPRRICAVTRGFQTTTQDLSVFPFYQDTIMWLVCNYNHSSLLSGHLWSLQ